MPVKISTISHPDVMDQFGIMPHRVTPSSHWINSNAFILQDQQQNVRSNMVV